MSNRVFLIRNTVGFGGGEIYQLNLAKMLRKSGYGPVIITNSQELIRRAKESGYSVLMPPYIERQNWSGVYNLLLPLYAVRLKKLEKWYDGVLKEHAPEIINVQSRDDFIAATIAAKKNSVKTIWTDHADFKSWVLTNVNVKFKNMIGKVIVDLSDETEKVIFVSRTVFDETKEMIKPMKLRNSIVIENGVFDECKKYSEVKAIKQSFVFIGRVVEEKGVAELLMAFSKVREKYPKTVLNIYGAGEIDEFKKIAGEGVVFHGETKEPLKALAENDIFVLPSYREGLSLSLLDAAMMGKKIIASDVDGNPEVIENKVSGLLVPAKSVEKLTEAMMWMIENPREASKMAQKARKQYEEKFDFEKIFAEKMLPLYNNRKELK